MSSQTHDTASNVYAEDGDVHVSGPDGVAVSLTPEAAAETSDRLLQGAAQAMGQRVEKRRADEEAKARH